MDQGNDSDDYELMPKKEIDKLRKEISGLKKNPYGVSDKGQDLQLSIERLNTTLNKFIAILEDAQQDIIDEYQESKPVEKLNQILDQNETIARALVTINNTLKGGTSSQAVSQTPQSSQASQASQTVAEDMSYPDFSMPKEKPQSPLQQFQQTPRAPQPPQYQQPQPFPQQSNTQNQPMPPNLSPSMNIPQFAQQSIQRPQFNQPMQSFPQQPMNNQSFPQQQFNQPPQQYQQQFGNIPPLDGLSLDSIPPLDAPSDAGMIPEKKKKFLGLI